MAYGLEWRADPGRICGTEVSGRRRVPIEMRWNVPLMRAERLAQLIEQLAHDPLLAGRWHAGRLSGNDCERVGLTETGWTPKCSCGAFQPCSHTRKLLHEFRRRAKTDPALWLAAIGVDVARLYQTVREARTEAVRSSPSRERSAPDERIRMRLKEQGSNRAGKESRSPLLPHMHDPAFWNRDVCLAEWLAPLYSAAGERKGEEEE